METGLIENTILSPRILLQRISSPLISSPVISSPGLSSPVIKCSICIENDIEDNTLCSTNCSHQFCKQCLDEWFDQGKITCPMCRSDIKYFDYQGDNTRIVRVPSVSEEQRINQGIMSILQVRIKLYKDKYWIN